jgi:uncharacterized phage protein (TIGR02218 family)
VRTLDAGFAAHVASGETTLSTCWRIARRDGVVLGFTDHDLTLSFAGLDYMPAHGLEGGEAAAKLGPSVDTAEVLGVLHAEAISEDDILLGRYDGAEVETWRVNWRDASQRHLVRRATIGEIVREDGVFRAELRSGQHALNVPKGRVYSALCEATVGDARCGVDLDAPELSATVSVTTVRDRHRVVVDGLGGFEAGWFSFGRAVWGSGVREGMTDRVMSHTRVGDDDVLAFELPVGDWVLAGDEVTVTAGCDRRFSTCKAKFANAVNFRGFPHIPGNDFVLKVPKAGDTLDGRALFE